MKLILNLKNIVDLHKVNSLEHQQHLILKKCLIENVMVNHYYQVLCKYISNFLIN